MRLSEAQRDLLSLLADRPRNGITHRQIAFALARKGLADYEAEPGSLIATHRWFITDAGRKALAIHPSSFTAGK